MDNEKINRKIQERQNEAAARAQSDAEKQKRIALEEEHSRAILEDPDVQAELQDKADAEQEKRDRKQAKRVGRNVLLQLRRGYTVVPAESFTLPFGDPANKILSTGVDDRVARMTPGSTRILTESLAAKGITAEVVRPESTYDNDYVRVTKVDENK